MAESHDTDFRHCSACMTVERHERPRKDCFRRTMTESMGVSVCVFACAYGGPAEGVSGTRSGKKPERGESRDDRIDPGDNDAASGSWVESNEGEEEADMNKCEGALNDG
jgi:hypothetical protein